MPPYRMPSWKTIVLRMWERGLLFLRRAGTVILALSILLWALATFPRKSQAGLHSGQAGLPVLFAGVVFREGHWLCADRDGIVVLPEAPPAG